MNTNKKFSQTTSLTEGCIWQQIIAFALPLFVGNLFQQLYNTADSLIVGNFLDSNAFTPLLGGWGLCVAVLGG